MSSVQATGADPYLVLNYDSCNKIFGSADWSYAQLGQLAISWLQYIARKGYSVRPRSLQGCLQHACAVMLLAKPPCSLDATLRQGRACNAATNPEGRAHDANQLAAHCTLHMQLLYGCNVPLPCLLSRCKIAQRGSNCMPALF